MYSSFRDFTYEYNIFPRTVLRVQFPFLYIFGNIFKESNAYIFVLLFLGLSPYLYEMII